MKKNADIRMMIDLYGLKHKAIAEHMGFSRQYFSQLLNSDLSVERADYIKWVIREVAKTGGGNIDNVSREEPPSCSNCKYFIAAVGVEDVKVCISPKFHKKYGEVLALRVNDEMFDRAAEAICCVCDGYIHCYMRKEDVDTSEKEREKA